MCNALNDVKLMLHYMSRNNVHNLDSDRSIDICRLNMKIMEDFGDGAVPTAWYSIYAWHAMVKAAAHFGKGEKDEGYRSLDIALDYYEKFFAFEKGALLDLGNAGAFGNIKYEKGTSILLLPDGKKEPMPYAYRIDADPNRVYYILKHAPAWSWFDIVRGEEAFCQRTERAKQFC